MKSEQTSPRIPLLSTALAFSMGMVLSAILATQSNLGSTLKTIVDQRTGSSKALSLESGFPISEAHQGRLQLFILAGQSNMSGMGELPSETMPENSQVYVFGNDYRWKIAREPIDDATGQIDPVSIDRPAGYSPALSFATTLLEQNPQMVIGLIPCAKGGSSIHEWQRSLSEDTLYGSCLKRIRAASVMGDVAGILYFQGEIDTLNPQEVPEKVLLPHQWNEEFTRLVNHWRQDLNRPDLPVVFAQIGSHTEPERFIHWDTVQAQQQSVKLPHTAMITTDDLALADYVHFTTASYQVIGQRFGDAYIKLVQNHQP